MSPIRTMTLWKATALTGPANFPAPESIYIAAERRAIAEAAARAEFAARTDVPPRDVNLLGIRREGSVYVP